MTKVNSNLAGVKDLEKVDIKEAKDKTKKIETVQAKANIEGPLKRQINDIGDTREAHFMPKPV